MPARSAAGELTQLLVTAARELEAARWRRDRLIVLASERGMSRREVAAAVGLSPAGVQYVLERWRKDAKASK